MQRHEGAGFKSSYGIISKHVGARKLGYNLTVLEPGQTGSPFHNHRIVEELFVVLEGTGVARFGEREYPLRPNDVLACPPGGRELAHQIRNTGTVDLKFLAISTKEPEDICEYPDSNKIGVSAGDWPNLILSKMFKADQSVDYFDGENAPR
jgi:uncharacterized cupin superfamily protein